MEPLFNMAKCYATNQRIADVPPARCMNCEDLGSCRAYVLLSRKKRWE